MICRIRDTPPVGWHVTCRKYPPSRGVAPTWRATGRLFDPQTRLWSIYRADSSGLKLDGGKVGSFDGDIGEFFARDVFAGKNVIVKYHWDKRNPKAPVYSAAFSVDEGRTWEWNWYAYFARL